MLNHLRSSSTVLLSRRLPPMPGSWRIGLQRPLCLLVSISWSPCLLRRYCCGVYIPFLFKFRLLIAERISRDCLIKPSKSIDQIQKSYNRFGPSNWVSLHNRDSLWIEDVIRAFQLLGESTTILAEVMNNLEHAIDNHPDISSILFLLQPGKYRHERRVGVITNDILSLLKDWVNCVVIQGGRLPHRHAEWILRSQISCWANFWNV